MKGKIKKEYALKNLLLISLCLILVANIFTCNLNSGEEFSFIIAADWREKATESFHTSEYFKGALNAIQNVGKGSFMISPGDVEPISDSRDLISKVLAQDYPWYPAVGNHELESEKYMNYIRQYNKGGTTLPNVVRKGPTGCEETTYSFDWNNSHFVVLNQYFDGKSDVGTDGDIVPELLAWLENDLASNTKPIIFVSGHEPLIPMPDMDNGKIRHQGNSLDQYPNRAHSFYQLLMKYNVTAYICGHTHCTSISKINGLWQIDAGHARGIETIYPELMITQILKYIKDGQKHNIDSTNSILNYYNDNKYNIKKVLFYCELTNEVHYKNMADEQAVPALYQFYNNYQNNPVKKEKYIDTYWNNWNLTKSTFMKVSIINKEVKVLVYRNDARGGPYSLTYTEILN